MDIDRYVQFHRGREQIIKARMIKEAAICRAIDERTHAAQSPNRLSRTRRQQRLGAEASQRAVPAGLSGEEQRDDDDCGLGERCGAMRINFQRITSANRLSL